MAGTNERVNYTIASLLVYESTQNGPKLYQDEFSSVNLHNLQDIKVDMKF